YILSIFFQFKAKLKSLFMRKKSGIGLSSHFHYIGSIEDWEYFLPSRIVRFALMHRHFQTYTVSAFIVVADISADINFFSGKHTDKFTDILSIRYAILPSLAFQLQTIVEMRHPERCKKAHQLKHR